MKIIYLKLKNFATIYTAMNKKELEIDFTKCKNNIILLVGKNGSGKTSILSTLHPFAYAGSMDVRNNSNLILDDKDGYKEIHIKNNEDIYKIQHFYKNSKRGIQVKSFIQKNDEELNKNGNVTSFNDIIRDELSLELDFLRLLRLGSNVSNLIDMKTSERKNFTSDLLSDISIYTELFKKINDDNRLLKNVMHTVSDKIEKLNVGDRDLLLNEIETIKKSIISLSTIKDDYQRQYGILMGRIKEILPNGIESAINDKRIMENKMKTLLNDIDNSYKKINKMCIILIKDIDSEIEDVNININSIESKINYNTSMLEFYNKELSKLYDEDEENENKIRSFTSNLEYHQITNLHLELTNKNKDFEKRFNNYTPEYTKDNLLSIINISHQIDKIIHDIYEYDTRSITKTIELVRNGINIDKYINNELNRIDKEILKISAKFKNSNALNTPIILFRPKNCCESECPYLFLYDLLFSNDDTEKNSITSLETEKNILNDIISISKNLDYIFMLIKTNMQLLNKGSIHFLSIENILNTIGNGQLINGEEFLMDLISDVEDYDEYQMTKSKLKDITAEIKMINNNKEHIDLLTENKRKIFNKITDMIKVVQTFKDNDSILQSELYNLNIYKEKIKSYKDISDIIDEMKKEYQTIKNNNDILNDKMSNVTIFTSEIKELDIKITNNEWELKKMNENLMSKQILIKEFDSLIKERNILNDKFDDINILKESLSSTKGIPLLFIQLYLKNTKMYVNNLLELIYSDGFEIDDFEITSTDFNIPYIKDGMRISDVSFASQGEKSFLSLALSFALITQSIKKYNILLLDEIDSTLDTRNRAMFLAILEKQMEIINAEQVFLITHNNMFDNYPVDIILTSSNQTENYNNANIIYSN